jgi:hypothetical protein
VNTSELGTLAELKVAASARPVKFDPAICDMLGVYIQPIDSVLLIPSSTITAKCEIWISQEMMDTWKVPLNGRQLVLNTRVV